MEVALGLVVGKAVGVLGLAVVAGIGFTVSLFVTSLAFSDPALTDAAKIGVLAGSAVAGTAGYLLLRAVPRPGP